MFHYYVHQAYLILALMAEDHIPLLRLFAGVSHLGESCRCTGVRWRARSGEVRCTGVCLLLAHATVHRVM